MCHLMTCNGYIDSINVSINAVYCINIIVYVEYNVLLIGCRSVSPCMTRISIDILFCIDLLLLCGIILQNMKCIYVFCHVWTKKWHMCLNSFLVEDNYTFMLHDQYPCCWCPGDARRRGINSHDIDSSYHRLLQQYQPLREQFHYKNTALLV